MLSAADSVNHSEPSLANVMPIGFDRSVGILNSTIWGFGADGSMRPIVLPNGVVNQSRHAASAVMLPAPASAFGSGNTWVSCVSGSKRPITESVPENRFPIDGVVNQIAPSPPVASAYGVRFVGSGRGSTTGKLSLVPSGATRTSSALFVVSHSAPSLPRAIRPPAPTVPGRSKLVISPVAGSIRRTSLLANGDAHRFPSGPSTRSFTVLPPDSPGAAPSGTGTSNRETWPSVVILSTELAPGSTTQMLSSGPIVRPIGYDNDVSSPNSLTG